VGRIFFEVRNLVKYFGGHAAVNNVSFHVEKGEILGLIGPNGSGKTTLFNLINNRYPVDSGTIHFKNRDITGMQTHRISRLGIGRTFQLVKPIRGLTVLENVMAAAFSKTRCKNNSREKALAVLHFCHLDHLMDLSSERLSLGERKRLEISRALATDPRLLLLDEMTSGLNPVEQEEAIVLIRKIRETGVAIIIVEHIMKVIMTLSDRIHALNFGRTIAEGTPEEVAAHPAVISAYLGGSDVEG